MRLIVIETALKGGLFDAVTETAHSAEEVARLTTSDPRATRMILDELCGLGLMSKEEALYALTPESRTYFAKDSLLNVRRMFEHGLAISEPWRALPDVLRSGKPAQQVDRPDRGPEFFKELVRAIFPVSHASSLLLADHLDLPADAPLRVLDVAGGSGAWSLAFARRHPNARVTVLDFPPVLDVAREYAQKLGVADHVEYASGNIRDYEFGEARYDIVILGHICHSEGAEWSDKLIAKSARALKHGGLLLIADMVPEEDRCGPEFPLLFAINMLVNTTEGDTFTLNEYRKWTGKAGLVDTDLVDAEGLACDVVIARKPE